MADLVIRNGFIVDGTGRKPYVGDVAVKDGLISSIGPNLNVQGVREIDATDRVVSPGWVDIHTHLDAQITWDPVIEPLTSNGVTTLVIGNCGVGFAPCQKERRTFLMELMEGVEDIPFGCMEAGIQWHWETFPEFMDYLDSLSLGSDVAAFVGHGAVRAFCLGEKANIPDLPGAYKDPASQITPDEVRSMAKVVKEAIEAGAIGFSTSRTLLHRDKWGTLVPGTLATVEEILALSKAMAEGGGGVFEMASDFMSYDDAPHTDDDHALRLERFGREWIWIEQISKGFGLPVTVCLGIPSVLTPDLDANVFRFMFQNASDANAGGSNIKLQVFTRPQGLQMCWDSRSHPFVECPTYLKLMRDAMKTGSRIDKPAVFDPQIRAQILKETKELAANADEDAGTFGVVLPTQTDDEEDIAIGNMNGSVSGRGALAKFLMSGAPYIYKWSKDYEPGPEDSLEFHANRQGRHVLDLLYDWMCEKDGTAVVSFLFMNYNKQNLDATTEMLYHKDSLPGLGDAGAHQGFIVDTTSHTYLLTHHVRDRIKGKRISIESAVKMQTSDTAKFFGFTDRGELVVGKKADINVINMNELECLCPEYVADLPAGGSRWIQKATGYDYTILSGQVVHDHGQHTGALPGRLVRNARRGQGVPEGYKYGELTGKMSMWFTNLRLESKQLAFKTLLRVLGPSSLITFGKYMNSFPLNESNYSHL